MRAMWQVSIDCFDADAWRKRALMSYLWDSFVSVLPYVTVGEETQVHVCQSVFSVAFQLGSIYNFKLYKCKTNVIPVTLSSLRYYFTKAISISKWEFKEENYLISLPRMFQQVELSRKHNLLYLFHFAAAL